MTAIAELFEQQGRTENAEAIYATLQEANPKSDIAHKGLARAGSASAANNKSPGRKLASSGVQLNGIEDVQVTVASEVHPKSVSKQIHAANSADHTRSTITVAASEGGSGGDGEGTVVGASFQTSVTRSIPRSADAMTSETNSTTVNSSDSKTVNSSDDLSAVLKDSAQRLLIDAVRREVEMQSVQKSTLAN